MVMVDVPPPLLLLVLGALVRVTLARLEPILLSFTFMGVDINIAVPIFKNLKALSLFSGGRAFSLRTELAESRECKSLQDAALAAAASKALAFFTKKLADSAQTGATKHNERMRVHKYFI